MLRPLNRALKRLRARRRARREAAARALCDRIITGCTNPARRSIYLYAAGRSRDPILQARCLADLYVAFGDGALA